MWIPLIGYIAYSIYYLKTGDESYPHKPLFWWAMYQLVNIIFLIPTVKHLIGLWT